MITVWRWLPFNFKFNFSWTKTIADILKCHVNTDWNHIGLISVKADLDNAVKAWLHPARTHINWATAVWTEGAHCSQIQLHRQKKWKICLMILLSKVKLLFLNHCQIFFYGLLYILEMAVYLQPLPPCIPDDVPALGNQFILDYFL